MHMITFLVIVFSEETEHAKRIEELTCNSKNGSKIKGRNKKKGAEQIEIVTLEKFSHESTNEQC